MATSRSPQPSSGWRSSAAERAVAPPLGWSRGGAPLPSRGPDTIDVSVEVGAKRAFACALAWPGWCRGGRDESSALEALLAYGPRYAHVLRGTRLGFRVPADARVVERLEGDATTDFGAPGAAPSADAAPMTEADLRRARSLLRAGWEAFDRAVEAAAGRTLATGPRGGG